MSGIEWMFHATAMGPSYDAILDPLARLFGCRVLHDNEVPTRGVERRGGMTWIADNSIEIGQPLGDASPVHRFVERFEVLGGEVGFQTAGHERVVRAGDAAVEVPAGTVHDWWNAGAGIARVRVEVAATGEAPGRPAARFVSMIAMRIAELSKLSNSPVRYGEGSSSSSATRSRSGVLTTVSPSR